MNLKRLIHQLRYNPIDIVRGFLYHFPWLVSDKTYVRIQYKAALGYYPNLKNPETFTEKLQWLKLYDHNPLYTTVVDKVKVKDYIKDLIGEEYIIPTLGVWSNPDDIEFNKLPERFVLKCNHMGGGSVFICKDKRKFNEEDVRKSLGKQLKKSMFLKCREWPYKNIERKILCEQFMEDKSGELNDFKFYCFNGQVKILLVASNRFTTHNFNYFDVNFKPVDIDCQAGSPSEKVIEKPKNFEKMLEIAEKLSIGFPHVRVDLYNCEGRIYFGELTLYDDSGFDDMNSEYWNKKMGEWITLPTVNV